LILLVAGLVTGGCSTSFPLSSLIPGMQAEKPADKDELTGSLSMQQPCVGNTFHIYFEPCRWQALHGVSRVFRT